MVTNRKGNSEPAHTGPSARPANSLNGGAEITGRTMMMATASMMMVPTFMKVER